VDLRRIRLALARNEIDALTAFLLRYYRDGVAQVDHVDFDVGIGDESGYLTF
jgi:hypothetical protein